MYLVSYWGIVICIDGGGLGNNVSASSTEMQCTSSFSVFRLYTQFRSISIYTSEQKIICCQK
jgi:hypothetical protein